MADYDGVIKWMKKLDIPITRQNFIDFSWGDEPPERWDAEAENQLPPELQDWSWLEEHVDKEDDTELPEDLLEGIDDQ